MISILFYGFHSSLSILSLTFPIDNFSNIKRVSLGKFCMTWKRPILLVSLLYPYHSLHGKSKPLQTILFIGLQ